MWLVIMLVATWSIYIQDGQINRDGLLYLKQAYLIAEGNWKEGLALYPWPFFSILIAIFHKLINLHLQLLAHGIDLALFGIASLFYLKILQLIYKKEKQIIFYGGIILLSFIPIMDDYVGMVLREHGLWAGCMMGTYFYFQSLEKYSLKNSITWQLGFLFSGLFRPEGLIFLFLLPLWNLWCSKQKRIQQLIQDSGVLVMLGILSLIGIFISGMDALSILSSSRLIEFVQRPIQFLYQLIQPLPLNSSNYYLAKFLDDYSMVITYSFLIGILLFKWIKGLSMMHSVLLIYHFIKPQKNNYLKHLYFFLIISFIIVVVNLINVYVLSNRYWSFHWWWIFILIAKTLAILIDSRKTKNFIKYSLFILISVLFFNTLVDKSDNLEQVVAKYILDNQLVGVDYDINHRINYYVNHEVRDLFKDTNERKFEYKIVKNFNKKNDEISLVIKNFPEHEPKYILIKNVQ